MRKTGIKRKNRRVKRVVEGIVLQRVVGGILLLILTAEEILTEKKIHTEKRTEILTERKIRTERRIEILVGKKRRRRVDLILSVYH